MKSKLLIFIITIVGLTSCITERKCERLYPTPIINKTDTTYINTPIPVYIHDTTFIYGDTIYRTDTVIVDKNGNINSDKLWAYGNFADAWAQVVSNELLLKLIEKDTMLVKLLTDTIYIDVPTITDTNTIIKKIWVTHWYHTVSMFISICILIFLLAYVTIKLVGSKINLFKKN